MYSFDLKTLSTQNWRFCCVKNVQCKHRIPFIFKKSPFLDSAAVSLTDQSEACVTLSLQPITALLIPANQRSLSAALGQSEESQLCDVTVAVDLVS